MKKKTPVLRFQETKARTKADDQPWHNGGKIEIQMYARSLQKAAKALVEKLEIEQNPKTAWTACPVVLLYRQALELHLKALVGEGSNFLPSPTDPITLYTTHSLRWLAQIVCQIIRAVKWERDFKRDGVASLADFSALVNEVESFDPVAKVVHSIKREGPDAITKFYRTFEIMLFAKKLDALLDLLDATADALAATWDQQADVSGEEKLHAGDNIKPTIQLDRGAPQI